MTITEILILFIVTCLVTCFITHKLYQLWLNRNITADITDDITADFDIDGDTLNFTIPGGGKMQMLVKFETDKNGRRITSNTYEVYNKNDKLIALHIAGKKSPPASGEQK